MNDKAFQDALAQYAPSIRQAFIDAVQDITDNAVLDQVVKALERGDPDAAWRALGYNPSIWSRFVTALRATFEQGGLLSIAIMPKHVINEEGLKVPVRFNVRDRRAETWLSEESSRLITAVEDDMRTNVRKALEVGLAEGRNPRNTALDIVGRINRETGHREGGTLGLTVQQEEWSRSARTRLLTLDEAYFTMELRDKRFDATVRKAIDAGKPLLIETVEKLVTRYRDNALRSRGENVGRTETLAALNRSEFEATMQALERNGKPMEAAYKVWDSAGDRRVRPEHVELDEQRVRIDQPFVTSAGVRMMHPGDTTLGAPGRSVIGCRCRVRYDIDFAYGIKLDG